MNAPKEAVQPGEEETGPVKGKASWAQAHNPCGLSLSLSGSGALGQGGRGTWQGAPCSRARQPGPSPGIDHWQGSPRSVINHPGLMGPLFWKIPEQSASPLPFFLQKRGGVRELLVASSSPALRRPGVGLQAILLRLSPTSIAVHLGPWVGGLAVVVSGRRGCCLPAAPLMQSWTPRPVLEIGQPQTRPRPLGLWSPPHAGPQGSVPHSPSREPLGGWPQRRIGVTRWKDTGGGDASGKSMLVRTGIPQMCPSAGPGSRSGHGPGFQEVSPEPLEGTT